MWKPLRFIGILTIVLSFITFMTGISMYNDWSTQGGGLAMMGWSVSVAFGALLLLGFSSLLQDVAAIRAHLTKEADPAPARDDLKEWYETERAQGRL